MGLQRPRALPQCSSTANSLAVPPSPATAPSPALALCSFLCGPLSQAGLPYMRLAWSVSVQPTDQKLRGSGLAGAGFSTVQPIWRLLEPVQ